MNVDPEDTWLAVGAGISVTLFGLCIVLPILRIYCKKPTIKESRSDNDLTNMIDTEEESL